MQEKFGDKLAVLFVEDAGMSSRQIQSFALKRRWLGGHGIWTNEHPFKVELHKSSLLPACALLGADGKVLLSGNPLYLHDEMEAAIKKEIKKGQKGPEGTPKKLEGAWKEFFKGNYAKALDQARKHLQEGGELGEAAEKTVANLTARIGKIGGRVQALAAAAEFDAADDLLKALQKGTKGDGEWEEKLAELHSSLNSAEMKPERQAAKDLAKLEKKMFSKGVNSSILRDLAKLADKHSGTRAAERANQWVAVASG
jgi:NTP pyrophosphatase (non-canonical NTP hydrolase)